MERGDRRGLGAATAASVLAVALLLFACGGRKVIPPATAEDEMAAAEAAFAEGKDIKAIELYQRVIYNYPGHASVGDARWRLAESYFRNGDYLLAAGEYERFAKDFPAHERAPEGLYRTGVCYQRLSRPYPFEQADTQKAIDTFSSLRGRYGTSVWADSAEAQIGVLDDKLARKELETGCFYLKRGYYDSAIIYFETLLEEHPSSAAAPPAYYHLGECYERLGLPDEARGARRALLERFPDTPEAVKVRQLHPELVEEISRSAPGG